MSAHPVPSPLLLCFPFRGRWVARNSPANRVPSHGTHLFGSSHAIDFVEVDVHGRSARRGWRSWFASEPPDAFTGFGSTITAPIAGEVAAAEDGEPDHVARRSLFAGVPYLLSQRERVRAGARAIAGNHVVIALRPDGPFVLLAHLRHGSVCARVGDKVGVGTPIGACGNSGNSTEPHVHVQASDSIDEVSARGIPIAFASASGAKGEEWMPRNGEAFEVQ